MHKRCSTNLSTQARCIRTATKSRRRLSCASGCDRIIYWPPVGSDRALSRVLLDASLRRFIVQKAYMRAVAALRWIHARSAILNGQRPQQHHANALAQITQTLRGVSTATRWQMSRPTNDSTQELASITDARVELTIRASETSQGRWLVEDPSLAMITTMLRPR